MDQNDHKTALLLFPIALLKINRFQCFLVWEFLRKFDINSLYICPPNCIL